MPSEKYKAVLIAILALALGILTDYLLFKKTSGIAFFIFNLAVIFSLLVLVFEFKIKPEMNRILIVSFIILFSFAIISRLSGFLILFDVAAVLYLFSLLFAIFFKSGFSNFKLLDYILFPLFSILGSFVAAEKYVAKNFLFMNKENKRGSNRFFGIFRGIVIAIPFLVILGWLLYSSDAVIQAYMSKIGRVDLDLTSILHLLIVFVAACFFAGVFARIATGEKSESLSAEEKENRTLGFIESLTVLTLVEALFLAFIIFQFFYLFGGRDYVWGLTETITYSSYARKGFFELVLVSAVSFLMIYALERSAKRESAKQIKVFKISETVIVSEILIIIFSAYRRFALYVDGYGLTFPRFIVIMFLFWILCLFLVFLARVFFEKKRAFVYHSMFWITAGLWLFINILNPDSFIAKTNVARLDLGKEVDYNYITSLSQDAIPEIVKIFDSAAKEEAKQEIAISLYGRYNFNFNHICKYPPYGKSECEYRPIVKLIEDANKHNDWRSFNYSKMKAEMALMKHSDDIENYAKQYQERQEKDCEKQADYCENACETGMSKDLLVPKCKENCGRKSCDILYLDISQ
ncbi:MAG: DUF4173 domain-containing protein [Candidatus Paceibacterota bacterium]|jgi:hypothetical protein